VAPVRAYAALGDSISIDEYAGAPGRRAAEGYRVTYRVFSGGHAVPSEIAREAVDWLG